MTDQAQGAQQGGGRVDAAPGDGAARETGADRGQGAAPVAGHAGPAGGVRARVRYFAGAAAAAGTEEELLVLPAGATLGDLRAGVLDLHPAMERVLAVSTTLVDEVAVSRDAFALPDGVGVDVLPPFAGG